MAGVFFTAWCYPQYGITILIFWASGRGVFFYSVVFHFFWLITLRALVVVVRGKVGRTPPLLLSSKGTWQRHRGAFVFALLRPWPSWDCPERILFFSVCGNKPYNKSIRKPNSYTIISLHHQQQSVGQRSLWGKIIRAICEHSAAKIRHRSSSLSCYNF